MIRFMSIGYRWGLKMKSMIRKVALVIMAAALSMSFTACLNALNQNSAKDISNLLKNKYGQEFEVLSIGNRLASDRADTVTARCCPKDDPSIVFDAVMNVKRELVSDNYAIRILEVDAQKHIEKRFKESGIAATVIVSIARLPGTEDFSGMRYDDLVPEHSDLSFTFTTIIREDADPKSVFDTVSALLSEYYTGNSKMLLGTTIWKYAESEYAECSAKMSGLPSISETVLKQYNPISSVTVAIVDGSLNTDYGRFVGMYCRE